MEYQKIINFLDNTSNQPSKFRTKSRVEINDKSRGTYNINSQNKFENTILKSSLCDIMMCICLLKELWQSQILQLLMLMQIMLIKNSV